MKLIFIGIIVWSMLFLTISNEEQEAAQERVDFCKERQLRLENTRNTFLLNQVVPSIFNNSIYLLYLAEIQSTEIINTLHQQFVNYEIHLCHTMVLENTCCSSSRKITDNKFIILFAIFFIFVKLHLV